MSPEVPALMLISGTLDRVTWREQYEDFVIGRDDRRTAGVGAAAAAATEQWLAAANLSVVTTDSGYKMSHFQGYLGDRRVHGRFYKPGFKEGDYLEAVGHTSGNETFEVMAIRRPADRRLWLLPECERGYRAQRNHQWKWAIIISCILIPMVAAVLAGLEIFQQDGEQSQSNWPVNFLIWGLVSIATGAFNAHFFWGWYKRTKHYGYLATGIFKAFGYDDPENVDAKKISSTIISRALRERNSISVEVFSYLY